MFANTSCRHAACQLVARYGFQASEQGIEEMEMELEFLEEDGDVYVTCIDCIDCIGPLDGPSYGILE